MEPRPEGRGDRKIHIDVVPFAMASMEPRPEGRGDSLSHTTPPKIRTMLQWSHGPKAVETFFEKDVGALDREASMEPRPEGRGDPGYENVKVTVGLASMEPRPEGRGDSR